MGDWRTVFIDGSCAAEDLEKLKSAVFYDQKTGSNFHCLTATDGLAGLGMWPALRIHKIGNLAERDYTVQNLADQLHRLVEIAPTLRIKVHCGGDYESKECAATITVGNWRVLVGPPEIQTLPDIPDDQMQANMLRILQRNP